VLPLSCYRDKSDNEEAGTDTSSGADTGRATDTTPDGETVSDADTETGDGTGDGMDGDPDSDTDYQENTDGDTETSYVCPPERIREPITWEAVTKVGLSPEEAFSDMAGTCTGLLSWDGADLLREVTPTTGESEVTVTVFLMPATARLAEPEVPTGNPDCDRAVLEVEGTATIRTADGAFDDTGALLLTYETGVGQSGSHLSVPLAETGGTLAVALEEGDDGELYYTLKDVGERCAGQVSISVSNPAEFDAGMSEIVLGSWSGSP
jgi:hypothetical protein